MTHDVQNLEPKVVWKNFASLNAVPRPSKKEEKVIRFVTEFGKTHELETFRDATGNVIIRKPATAGMESHKMITLQSHLDMVHQKNSAIPFDFEREGIQMVVEGEWVRARGTTLGADNGLGVAAMLALLQSGDIPHPPLEALFTIDEETGMTGAMGLQKGLLQGSILLNLDTENDSEIDIGCAGGIDVTATLEYRAEAVPRDSKAFSVAVKGLQGGHSGMDIHRRLGNANKIMNGLLHAAMDRGSLRIGAMDGGGLRNAIPRESVATVVVPLAGSKSLESFMVTETRKICAGWEQTEPGISIHITPAKLPATVMDRDSQAQLVRAVDLLPNGVFSMSATIPGIVETSNNLAMVRIGNGKVTMGCLTRSSVASSKMELANHLKTIFRKAGCLVDLSGEYPGWEPDEDSAILKIARREYKRLFGEEPHVTACHAGLECGILKASYPDMDMISFGPTIQGAHSPDERANIASVEKFWQFLKAILKNIPQ